MAQEEFDPLDLLSKVAMLVLEARTPHQSAKGRVEGPHCQVSAKHWPRHECVPQFHECKRAQEMQQRIEVLWRNGIPSCMDILLFPDCIHGRQEASSLDGAGNDGTENALLLERWSLKHIKKWHGEWAQGVAGSMLLQAVRSYLYFSQLSSWLASTRGSLPGYVAYRFYAPGECSDVAFKEPPQIHAFPSAIYGPHGLKVTVHYLPRQPTFPYLSCGVDSPVGFRKVLGRDGEGATADSVLKELGRGSPGCSYTSGVRKRAAGSPRDDQQGSSGASSRKYSAEQQSGNVVHPCKVLDTPSSVSPSQGKFHSQSKVRVEKSSTREALEGQLRPLELTSPSAAKSLDLHSPKVLMSDVLYNPYPSSHRKQLDFSHPPTPPHSDQHHHQQRTEEQQQQQFLIQHYMQGASPLSPLDISAFLCNLQSISAPILRPQPDLTPPLAYHLSAEKAARLDMPGFLVGFQPPGTAGLNQPQAKEEQHEARFRKKRALPFGGDPPPAGSPEAAKSRPSSSAAWPMSPADQDSGLYLKKLPLCLSDQKAKKKDTDTLTKRDKDLLTSANRKDADVLTRAKSDTDILVVGDGKMKGVKKKKDPKVDRSQTGCMAEILAAITHMKDSSLLQDRTPESSVTLPHSTPFSPSDPVQHTLRDLGKIVRARKKPSSQPSSLPDSWSSSSSSSSTYSSSPKVSTEGGERHSDSSTPTNLSSSPLPEDSLPTSQHSQSPADSAGQTVSDIVCPHSSVCKVDQGGESSALKSSVIHTTSPSSLATSSKTSNASFDSSHPDTSLNQKQHHEQDHHTLCSPRADSPGLRMDSSQQNQLHSKDSVRHPPGQLSVKNASLTRNQLQQHCKHHPVPCRSDVAVQSPSVSQYRTDSDLTPDDHTENHSTAFSDGAEDVADKPQPLCTFYLESSTLPPCVDAQTSHWHSESETEESLLVSCLDKLHLQPQSPPGEVCSGPSPDLEEALVSEVSQSNGCVAADSIPSRSQDQSNGCLVKPDTSPERCDCDLRPSLNNKQTSNGCVDRSNQSDTSLLLTENPCPHVSIPSSSLVLHPENAAFQTKPSPQSLPEIPPSQLSAKNSGLSAKSSGLSVENSGLSVKNSGLSAKSSGLSAKSSGLSVKESGLSAKNLGLSVENSGLSAKNSGLCVKNSAFQQHSNGSAGAADQKYTTLQHQGEAVCMDDSAEEDSVFYDKPCDAENRPAAHCPTRTKSAPNISCLSDNMKMKVRTESADKLSPDEVRRGRSALREKEGGKVLGPDRLRHRLVKSASMLFNSRGSVPSQSSPAPVKRRSTGRFDYDETLTTTKAIKSAISLSRLPDVCKDSSAALSQPDRVLSTSAPASTNCLLGNFEESVLNGRLEPAGVVEGFSVDIGASGDFCPRHLSLPVTAYFFNLSDDNAPSPYLGHISLDQVGKRGYHIPNTGTVQVTLFNPNKTVVKMFVVKYDLQDMPANSQTVLRQRTVYEPVDPTSDLPSYLRYLIHLRISSSSSKKIYLHTDIRLIFARNKFELDGSVAQYELRSYTETPVNPKYSPKR